MRKGPNADPWCASDVGTAVARGPVSMGAHHSKAIQERKALRIEGGPGVDNDGHVLKAMVQRG